MFQQDYVPNECEACASNGKLNRINGLWLCESCALLEKEEIERKHASEKMQQVRIENAQALIEAKRKIDTSFTIRTELFNAETISIAELKEAIELDPTIENKQFKLAEMIQDAINEYQKLIFSKNEEIMELHTKQRAQQSYLNELSNKLRSEEREKLRLQDINYQPKAPVLKPKPATPKNTKASNKAEVKRYASELGVNESTIQAICVAMNKTPQEAAEWLKDSVAKAKSS